MWLTLLLNADDDGVIEAEISKLAALTGFAPSRFRDHKRAPLNAGLLERLKNPFGL